MASFDKLRMRGDKLRMGGDKLRMRGDKLRMGGDKLRMRGTATPITLAVVEHRLESIAQEMTEAMLRTAMSQILNSSRDFSTAILDGECQLVAQGEGIPVHISALPVAGAAVRDYFGDDIHDGDLFILNDPYFGGSHLPDITIIRPVFHQGRLLFYGVNRAHHSDVGGGTHGGYNPGANEIFQEGLRIPPLKLYDRGVPRNDLLQMMAANVRQSENFLGDLNAQIGSVMLAARRIADLLAEYGPDRLMAVVAEILNATERQVRQFVSGWPDGVYYGESFVDDDGFDSKPGAHQGEGHHRRRLHDHRPQRLQSAGRGLHQQRLRQHQVAGPRPPSCTWPPWTWPATKAPCGRCRLSHREASS